MAKVKNYRAVLRCFLFGLILFVIPSCSDDEDIIPEVPQEEEVRFTDQSGEVLVNTQDIVIGAKGGEEYWIDMVSTILTPQGKEEERTINCAAMASITLDENGVMDTSRPVENVTLINKGHIEVHTKELYELYKDQIQTPDHPERPYKYLRVLVMFGGKNSMVINEGVIDVYFDHDPTATATIYVMVLSANDGAQMVNKGTINFYGEGSVATRFRGMATFGENISAVNVGTMTADVKISEDVRMITTGGDNSNVINDGIMKVRAPGTVYCMTRYGSSNIVNNNTIEIASVDYPEGVTPINNPETLVACAMYDPLPGSSRTSVSPMVNRGNIRITMEGSDKSNPVRQGYGMFGDLMSPSGEAITLNVVNEGSIEVHQASPVRFRAAEAGFVVRESAPTAACNVTLGRWCTTLRDFAQTKDLFLVQGAKVNFGGGELLLIAGEDYVYGTTYSVAPGDLLYNADQEGIFRYEHTGYENFKVKAADYNLKVLWDKEAMTVALEPKKKE